MNTTTNYCRHCYHWIFCCGYTNNNQPIINKDKHNNSSTPLERQPLIIVSSNMIQTPSPLIFTRTDYATTPTTTSTAVTSSQPPSTVILTNNQQPMIITTTTTNNNDDDVTKTDNSTIIPTDTKPSRAFIIIHHNQRGYLILYARKIKKGEHGQLSGGKLDDNETPKDAALRELKEETGLEIDSKRLIRLFDIDKKRFFLLRITDSDSLPLSTSLTIEQQPTTQNSTVNNNNVKDFHIQLSSEHVRYEFIKDIENAAKAVLSHSGGSCSEALMKFKTHELFIL
jgi:8-oxo-dGTP pyrophosphatase MutT (NUDIX family)